MSEASKALRNIRPARTEEPREVDRLYDICLRTGADGDDASDRFTDPRILGDVYLGAYLKFEPELALVLEGDDGLPLGYVLGAADTLAFEELLEERWWPRLRARYPLGRFPADSIDEEVVKIIHNPPRVEAAVIDGYPAHLHVDILAAGQGGGNGRRLMEALFDALRARSIPGVHLGVSAENTNAIGFYQHLGFVRLHEDYWGKTL